jgi:hypothetical protein
MWSFMELIQNKTPSARKGKVDDEKKLKQFVAYHRKSFRQEGTAGNRRWVNGTFVENEMIWAVAHQNGIIINVAQASQPEIQVITPDGTFVRMDDERAESSPFFIWCTGEHYQALIKLQDVEVLSSALEKDSYVFGNVLQCDEIRIPA